MAHPENLEKQLKIRNRETDEKLRFIGNDLKSIKLTLRNTHLKD